MIGSDARDRDFGVPAVPEDREIFRLAQLLVLLEVADDSSVRVQSIDQLGYFDFFSGNPFTVVGDSSTRDRQDRIALRLVGFSDKQLSYASTGQRFVSRRRKLQHDLSRLVAYGLVHIHEDGYRISSKGKEIAYQLGSVYADAYRTAAGIVLRRFGRLTDRKLSEAAQAILGKSWLLIDFLDDVADPVPGESGRSLPSG